MKKDPAIFLQHILESIQTIEEFTKGLSEDAFLEDRRTQDAVVCAALIGYEALRYPYARAWIRSRRGAFTMEEAARVGRARGRASHREAV
jgi:hypothetical protein